MQSSLEIFKKISLIPHPSGDTKALREWICDYIRPYVDLIKIDKAGNIYCKKGSPNLCLQAHYDMVLVGDKKPLILKEENGFLSAKDSSLGADNGVSVALMLQILQCYDDLECLFTNDEEIGLLGAGGLEIPIESKRMLNLDSEFFGSIVVGCAGGFVLENKLDLKAYKNAYSYTYRIVSQDYLGGHSGIDIDKGRKNPICDIFALLSCVDYGIVSLRAGEFNNAIPTKLEFVIATDMALESKMILDDKKQGSFRVELLGETNQEVYCKEKLQQYILELNHGVWERDELGVCNSLNIGMIRQEKQEFVITLMGRANAKDKLEQNLHEQYRLAEKYSYNTNLLEFYPPWEDKKENNDGLLAYVSKAFEYRFVCRETLHAGLECGILKERFEQMGLGEVEMLSIGPTIFSPHSRNEKLDILSFLEFEKVMHRIMENRSAF